MQLKDIKPSITQLKSYEAENIHRQVRTNRSRPVPVAKRTSTQTKRAKTVAGIAAIKRDKNAIIQLLKILEGK